MDFGNDEEQTSTPDTKIEPRSETISMAPLDVMANNGDQPAEDLFPDGFAEFTIDFELMGWHGGDI
jgi:hypothetical protein